MKKLMTLLTLIAVGMFTVGCSDNAKQPAAKTESPAAKDAAKDTAEDTAEDTAKE